MKSLIFLLSLSLSLWLYALPQSFVVQVAQGQESTVKTSPMPAERAKATFEDERVKTFMAVVAKDFGGKCSIPDYTKTKAKLIQRGGGDFSSSSYEVSIPCPGNRGLAAVQITVEFSPPLEEPLNLILSLQYRK
jgi:hypothetical protein